MEKQVQLFPGVSVPYSVALWAKLVSRDNDGTHQSSNPKEDMATLLAAHLPQDALSAKFVGLVEYTIRAGDNGKEENIGDVVERWSAEEKARRSSRRKNTFRQVETRKYHQPDPRPQMPLRYELEELSGSEITKKQWGTNRILEQILGLSDGSSRTRFLMELKDGKCDDNYSKCFEGAEIVRAALHLAQFYGLVENYSGNPQRRAKIFRTILDSVNKGSIQLTDALIDHFSLKEMPGLMSRYQPFRKFDVLVPKKDVYTIASAMETPRLRQLGGPALMSELGYKAIYHAGTPILYYMPKLR